MKFTSLSQLEKHLQNNLSNKIWKDKKIEDVVADEMSQAVWDVVYSAYSPKQYERRGDLDGLSDPNNVEITWIEPTSNGLKVTIENLTEGNDSMQGEFITDTIEEGISENWNNPNGVWSEPRPFVAETIERLQDNPTELTNALKQSLKEMGFNVK